MGPTIMKTSLLPENSGSIRSTVYKGIVVVLLATNSITPWTGDIQPSIIPSDASPLRSFENIDPTDAQQARVVDCSQWISELEESTQLTRAGLAALIGVTRPTLYSWANGKDIRSQNAKKLLALRTAVRMMTKAAGGPLPPLWQHQPLPSFGMSFVEGMRKNVDPTSMASEIVTMWARDRDESAAISMLFS